MAIERRRPTLPEIRQSGEYEHSLDVLRRKYPIAPEENTSQSYGVESHTSFCTTRC